MSIKCDISNSGRKKLHKDRQIDQRVQNTMLKMKLIIKNYKKTIIPKGWKTLFARDEINHKCLRKNYYSMLW